LFITSESVTYHISGKKLWRWRTIALCTYWKKPSHY